MEDKGITKKHRSNRSGTSSILAEVARFLARPPKQVRSTRAKISQAPGSPEGGSRSILGTSQGTREAKLNEGKTREGLSGTSHNRTPFKSFATKSGKKFEASSKEQSSPATGLLQRQQPKPSRLVLDYMQQKYDFALKTKEESSQERVKIIEVIKKRIESMGETLLAKEDDQAFAQRLSRGVLNKGFPGTPSKLIFSEPFLKTQTSPRSINQFSDKIVPNKEENATVSDWSWRFERSKNRSLDTNDKSPKNEVSQHKRQVSYYKAGEYYAAKPNSPKESVQNKKISILKSLMKVSIPISYDLLDHTSQRRFLTFNKTGSPLRASTLQSTIGQQPGGGTASTGESPGSSPKLLQIRQSCAQSKPKSCLVMKEAAQNQSAGMNAWLSASAKVCKLASTGQPLFDSLRQYFEACQCSEISSFPVAFNHLDDEC